MAFDSQGVWSEVGGDISGVGFGRVGSRSIECIICRRYFYGSFDGGGGREVGMVLV
jgi:hypothetical protein